MNPELDLATLCVQGGPRDDSPHRAVVPPIYQSATFALTEASFEGMLSGKPRDCLIYSRYGNPTIWTLEQQLARLEGAESALATASGMAAISSALLAATRPGDHVLAPAGAYGQTVVLLERMAADFGREFTELPDAEAESYEAALRPNTAVLWAESIGNPLGNVADLPRLAQLAHAHGAKLIVDATFSSPVLQQPLALGADLVVHSATKYLNGHSDVTAGVVAGPRAAVDAAWDLMRLLGSPLDPHAAYLLLRGLKTLHLRMERISQNALEVARALARHPAVDRVRYPGLAENPQHDRAARLLPHGQGGIVSFVLRGGDEAALRFCRNLRLVFEATSLGGVESLVSLPFNTSHANMTAEQRLRAGILPGTVRLAVGVESARDLVRDLEDSLDRIAGIPQA